MLHIAWANKLKKEKSWSGGSCRPQEMKYGVHAETPLTAIQSEYSMVKRPGKSKVLSVGADVRRVITHPNKVNKGRQ